VPGRLRRNFCAAEKKRPGATAAIPDGPACIPLSSQDLLGFILPFLNDPIPEQAKTQHASGQSPFFPVPWMSVCANYPPHGFFLRGGPCAKSGWEGHFRTGPAGSERQCREKGKRGRQPRKCRYMNRPGNGCIEGSFYMSDRKKIAAAVSAAMQFLAAEEEQLRKDRAAVPDLWALSGRQLMMQTRTRMQMRSFCGWKNR